MQNYAILLKIIEILMDCIKRGNMPFGSHRELAHSWKHQGDEGPHEASFLKRDCSKIKNILGWRPVWGWEEMIVKTVEWMWEYLSGSDVVELMERQIQGCLKEDR